MDTKEGPASFVKMTIKGSRSKTQNNSLYSLGAVEFLPEGVPAATWVNEAMTADGVSPRSTLPAETLSGIASSVQKDNARREIPQELFSKLKTRLKKVGLGHVKLEQDPSMDAQGAFESNKVVDSAPRVFPLRSKPKDPSKLPFSSRAGSPSNRRELAPGAKGGGQNVEAFGSETRRAPAYETSSPGNRGAALPLEPRVNRPFQTTA